MTYSSSISPEHRAHLRRLRDEFQTAFDAIDDPTDHTSPSYREADACYRTWMKAINSVAIQLLDDLDVYEAMMAPSRSSSDPPPDVDQESFEAGDLHSDVNQCAYARKVLDTPDPDTGDERLLSGMIVSFEAMEAGTVITGLRGAALVRSIRKGDTSLL